MKHTSVLTCNLRQGRTQSGKGLGAVALQPPQIEIKKTHTHRFVDKMVSNVLGDFPLSRIEPLKATAE
jgi:hypothetical protein